MVNVCTLGVTVNSAIYRSEEAGTDYWGPEVLTPTMLYMCIVYRCSFIICRL